MLDDFRVTTLNKCSFDDEVGNEMNILEHKGTKGPDMKDPYSHHQHIQLLRDCLMVRCISIWLDNLF